MIVGCHKVCRDVKVWKIILERQLFPVLSYGCHLWRLNIKYVRDTVNTAWRRVIRKGLGMKWGDSVKEKLGSWFKEASELMKRNQCLFIHRAVHSQNKTVREVSMATRKMGTSRVWNSIKFIGEGSCRLVCVFIQVSYIDIPIVTPFFAAILRQSYHQSVSFYRADVSLFQLVY